MHAVIRHSMGVLLLLLEMARAAIAQDPGVGDRTEALMALRSIAWFVTALCAFAVASVHADVSERFEVGLRLRVAPSVTARGLTDRLKTETEAIWEPYGVRLTWTDAGVAEPAANSIFVDASVERRFEGPQRAQWETVLGLVVVKPDASNRRPIRVSFEATERVLAARNTGRVSGAGLVLDRDLARALGRVLAHEIGHALLGAPYHAPAGLMRASFRADELGEPDRAPFRLTCSGVDRLRGRLRALRGDPQLVHQHNSTTLDLEGFRRTRSESSVGAACIPIQSAH